MPAPGSWRRSLRKLVRGCCGCVGIVAAVDDAPSDDPSPSSPRASGAAGRGVVVGEGGKRVALLVGLNYARDARLRLRGCWNDAVGLGALLKTEPYGFSDGDVQVLIDERPVDAQRTSRNALLEALLRLAQASWDRELEVAVVSFSGHGAQQLDRDDDEPDGLDEGICPSDCRRAGLIVDDDLHRVFSRFNPRTAVYAVFDCCHSGSIVDLPHTYPGPSTDGEKQGDGDAVAQRHSVAVADAEKPAAPRVVVISGCRDAQTSADAYNRATRAYGGALTMALLSVMQAPGGAQLGLRDVHAAVLALLRAQRHSQYPLLSSSHPIDNETRLFRPV